MAKIETYELTHLYKQIKQLQKKDLTASGIHIVLNKLDGTAIGEMEFIGELLPELFPVLLKSLDETLKIRLAAANGEIVSINRTLKGEN